MAKAKYNQSSILNNLADEDFDDIISAALLLSERLSDPQTSCREMEPNRNASSERTVIIMETYHCGNHICHGVKSVEIKLGLQEAKDTIFDPRIQFSHVMAELLNTIGDNAIDHDSGLQN